MVAGGGASSPAVAVVMLITCNDPALGSAPNIRTSRPPDFQILGLSIHVLYG